MSNRTRSTDRRPRLPAASCLAVALFACSDNRPVEPPATSVDLLARLAEARIEPGDLASIVAPLGPPAEADRILTDEMDGDRGAPWWLDGRDGEALRLPYLRVDAETALSLDASAPPAALLLASAPNDQYLVRVRWRAEGPAGGALVARGLLGAPERFDDPGASRDFLRQAGRRLAAGAERLPLGPGTGWQESEVSIGQEHGRRALLLRLLASEGTVEVDRVEVRRLTPLEAFVELAPTVAGASPLLRRLELPYETFDCLLLPAGSRVVYPLVVPATRPRLDTQVRILGGAPAATSVVVRIDGEEIGRARGDPRVGQEGDPWRLPLDAHAGRRVELELALDGPRGTVGILTAPRLLGSGDDRPAIVLVSLDTLRADHLGVYGDTRALSPTIDRLAREGTVFERVVSPASYTLPTHATLLTGQHPLVHGVRRRSHRIDPGRSRTLAERLRDEGYATVAFTGGGYVSPVFGFSRGFERYSTRDPAVSRHRLAAERRGLGAESEAAGGARMDRVLEWMDRYRDQPYLLFLHTYLVHGYFPQQRFLDRVAPGSGVEVADLRLTRLWERAEGGDAAALETLRSLYAATVAQADELVVAPLAQASERRASDGGQVILALVSDHGEQLMEHGALGHGGALWGELVDVPWILRGPGVPAGLRWSRPVGLSDVAPTLLDLLALAPGEATTGRARRDPAAEEEPAVILLHHEPEPRTRWDGLVTERWKLVRHQSGEALEWSLFDLARDPGETLDQAATAPETLAALRALLQERSRELLAARPPAEEPADAEELPESLARELRALGYVDP
jgi:arylsulfatase A-like enzyme